mgnify:CR=1 FL=1
MKRGKRILTILLTLCVAFTMMPLAEIAGMTAYAADGKGAEGEYLNVPAKFDKEIDISKVTGDIVIKDSKTYRHRKLRNPQRRTKRCRRAVIHFQREHCHIPGIYHKDKAVENTYQRSQNFYIGKCFRRHFRYKNIYMNMLFAGIGYAHPQKAGYQNAVGGNFHNPFRRRIQQAAGDNLPDNTEGTVKHEHTGNNAD